jgi:hypothetical protein
MHNLTYPAPRRFSEQTLNGYVLIPYDVNAVKLTLAGGGWFLKGGYHSFLNTDAARAAAGLPTKAGFDPVGGNYGI